MKPIRTALECLRTQESNGTSIPFRLAFRSARREKKLLLTLALAAMPAFAGFPNGYDYCKVVTTQHLMVSGPSDLVNFPLTVILTDADLKTVNNGGLVNHSLGYDIGFYPDCSGGGAPLKWEIESYNPSTGTLVAHVLRPTLSHAADDTIGMYYGGSFTSFQSTASAVWSANFKGVWHLPNGATVSALDSTGLNNGTLMNMPAAVAGVVDGAAGFTAASAQCVDVGGDSSLNISSDITLEAWIKPDSTATQLFITRLTSGGDGYALFASVGGTPSLFRLFMDVQSGGTERYVVSSPVISTGVFTHVVATLASGAMTLYINGVAASLNASDGQGAGAIGSNTTTSMFLGRDSRGPAYYMDGSLDEVRISDAARSADWILTEYRNQSDPAAHLSLGPRITSSQNRVRHSVRQLM